MNMTAPQTADALDLAGRRVLVMGLGVNQGGVGVVRFLCAQGAEVRVTDMQTPERLADALVELGGLPVSYTLGGHAEGDFQWAEVVVRNPAVPRESRWLALARQCGARIEMEMTLFFRACRGPILGVTGTKGKTTTSTALHTILRQRFPDAVLAGNMGRSALGQLDAIEETTPVVLELSSFQLEGLDERGLSPHVAVVTNVYEDHLDRYASLAEYAGVKSAIARHQGPGDWLVVNREDERLMAAMAGAGTAGRLTYGHVAPDGDDGLWIDGQRLASRWRGERLDLGAVEDITLIGEHARLNVLAAAGAALAMGVSAEQITTALPHITPVRDRLEHVAQLRGVRYVNDTTATVPAAAIAALRAFAGQRVFVIAGGSDKQVRFDEFACALARHAEHVVLLDGTATSKLADALIECGHPHVDGPFMSMRAAVERAAELARPGDVVLLSPGCASFGMFRNEFQRGDEFRAAVAALADEGGAP